MADELKIKRGHKRAAFTKSMNKLRRAVSLNNDCIIPDLLIATQGDFDAFQLAHDEYHDTLTEASGISESERYFEELDNAYSAALQECSSPKPSDNVLAHVLSLPRMEIPKFDGNPLKYYNFIAVFDECVDKPISDCQMKLMRLSQFTTGDANYAIRACVSVGGSEGYSEARDILKKRFGNDHLVSTKLLNELRDGRNVKTPMELLKLSDDLRNIYMVLQSANQLHVIDTQSIVSDVIKRLPAYCRDEWTKRAVAFRRENSKYPDYKELMAYVVEASEDANDPVYGESVFVRDGPVHHRYKGNGSSFNTSTRPLCPVCNADHRITYCDQFKGMTVKMRRQTASDHGLCYNCLCEGHFIKNCHSKFTCGIQGCDSKHNTYLHEYSDAIVNATVNKSVDLYMPVVRVLVNGSYTAYALLDTASTTSFCTKYIADKLGLKGVTTDFQLSTLTGNSTNVTNMVSVNLSTISGDNVRSLACYIVNHIPAHTPSVDISKYDYLQNLRFPCNVRVDFLIGQDNAGLLVPFEVRHGVGNQPFATRTLYGWCLNGPVVTTEHGSRAAAGVCNFVNADIVDRLDRLWEIDNEGINSSKLGNSHDDVKALNLWDQQCKFKDGNFVLPIPWKHDHSIAASNKHIALSRLMSLTKSLKRRNLYTHYDKEVSQLVDHGYAEYITDSSNDSRSWYLPHHGVHKKNGDLRVVFDCANKMNGLSLNDRCLQGPDMNNRLDDVLLRFRQFPYAFMGDVKSMYYQVVIPEEDRDALRFLWYDHKGGVVQLRMTRHVFGGVWCGSSATYALRKAAESNICSRGTRDIINNSFYVDDCLVSLPTSGEANAALKDTKDVLKHSGFQLTKFASNDTSVLEGISEEDCQQHPVDVLLADCKALGMKWNLGQDTFYFNKEFDVATKITRRHILKVIASIFDPLGLICPLLVEGRVIFQEVTLLKIGWDDPVPEKYKDRWVSWVTSLEELSALRVPRCIVPQVFNDAACELHVFSDASQHAYGACAYIRAVSKDAKIHTMLISAKSKVAPTKATTIPRLELQAAVMASRMKCKIQSAMDIRFVRVYMWTDSKVVLGYINNESRRFHVYVANRVNIIREATSPEDWNYISSAQNPADIPSRGCDVTGIDNVWLHGPSFLRQFKDEWEQDRPEWTVSLCDPEVKRGVTHSVDLVCQDQDLTHPIDKMSNHFSDWKKLQRSVAWLMLIQNKYKSGTRNKSMNSEMMSSAESTIIRHVQKKFYGEEMEALRETGSVKCSSNLSKLMPRLKDNLLRVGGRITHGIFDDKFKHPFIIPHDHPIATLIIRDEHDVAHLGREWVLSIVRRRYWIIRARNIMNKVSRDCLTCKKKFAKPMQQKMADLPLERLDWQHPPFFYVGVDCFGPFSVNYGRSSVKRYGCIFTCMSSRAVHLEKLNGLDADSFMNCLRRFIARRGLPAKMFSDNGTNLVYACKEAKSFFDVRDVVHKKGIEWCFNPPTASHMGGVWERMIRTTRKVLNGLLKFNVRFTDDMLETLLCEVENIVNGRPMTKLSDDVKDSLPLTPNHLLLIRSGCNDIEQTFNRGDMYRKQWRYVQHITNQFWRKWLREYVPELQRRNKWLKTETNLKQGDLVLVMDELTPRNVWPLGLVQETTSGRDGLVRSARIKTESTVLVRPITKLVHLEGDAR